MSIYLTCMIALYNISWYSTNTPLSILVVTRLQSYRLPVKWI